ncbi:MAG TPA: Uma2 family endonuclease [Mucilaginibacter sp.]
MLTAEKKKYTAEDYMMLEEGSPFQLINYNLIMSPSPTPIHQAISLQLTLALAHFLSQSDNHGYMAYAPLDVKFDEGNIMQPDLIYIASERKAGMITSVIEGAPDLIIEILSPSNAYYDLRQKKDIYQKYGVKEYIIVDPIAFNCELYTLKDGAYQLNQKKEKSEILNSVLLPGLTFDLSKVFNF